MDRDKIKPPSDFLYIQLNSGESNSSREQAQAAQNQQYGQPYQSQNLDNNRPPNSQVESAKQISTGNQQAVPQQSNFNYQYQAPGFIQNPNIPQPQPRQEGYLYPQQQNIQLAPQQSNYNYNYQQNQNYYQPPPNMGQNQNIPQPSGVPYQQYNNNMGQGQPVRQQANQNQYPSGTVFSEDLKIKDDENIFLRNGQVLVSQNNTGCKGIPFGYFLSSFITIGMAIALIVITLQRHCPLFSDCQLPPTDTNQCAQGRYSEYCDSYDIKGYFKCCQVDFSTAGMILLPFCLMSYLGQFVMACRYKNAQPILTGDEVDLHPQNNNPEQYLQKLMAERLQVFYSAKAYFRSVSSGRNASGGTTTLTITAPTFSTDIILEYGNCEDVSGDILSKVRDSKFCLLKVKLEFEFADPQLERVWMEKTQNEKRLAELNGQAFCRHFPTLNSHKYEQFCAKTSSDVPCLFGSFFYYFCALIGSVWIYMVYVRCTAQEINCTIRKRLYL